MAVRRTTKLALRKGIGNGLGAALTVAGAVGVDNVGSVASDSWDAVTENIVNAVLVTAGVAFVCWVNWDRIATWLGFINADRMKRRVKEWLDASHWFSVQDQPAPPGTTWALVSQDTRHNPPFPFSLLFMDDAPIPGLSLVTRFGFNCEDAAELTAYDWRELEICLMSSLVDDSVENAVVHPPADGTATGFFEIRIILFIHADQLTYESLYTGIERLHRAALRGKTYTEHIISIANFRAETAKATASQPPETVPAKKRPATRRSP